MTEEKITQPTNGTSAYRLSELEKDYKTQEQKIESLNKEIVDMKIELAKLQERMTIFQLAQAAFTTIAGVVASFIGRL